MTDAIRREIQEQIDSIGPCDVLIGIPSYNDADTIGPVVEAVRSGLTEHFQKAKAVFVKSDGGSMDKTPETFASAMGGVWSRMSRIGKRSSIWSAMNIRGI